MRTLFPLAIGIAASFLLVRPATAAETAPNSPPKPLEFYQRLAAEKFKSRLDLPTFETTAEGMEKSVSDTLSEGDKGLEKIGKQNLANVAFATTIGALDDVVYGVVTTANRCSLLKEVSTDPKLRAAAQEGLKKIQAWLVAVEYRDDVYKAVQAYEKTSPRLEGEEKKLYEETLRDYRRAGLNLPPDVRKEVERERTELSALETEFGSNITAAKAPVVFTRAELEGVPEDFLNDPKVKTGPDSYTIATNETYQAVMVLENAKREETRRKVYVARESRAIGNNVPLMNKILALRNSIALRLGYASWADYQIEPKMAKDEATATKFINELIAGTQPKFTAEVAEMQKLKAADTGNPQAVVSVWDWRYYENQIKKARYTVDTEKLRVYFPYAKTLAGMFSVYEKDFGLKFEPVEAPYKWVGDLQLFVTTDAGTGEPLGLFYLDMFPRDGKYSHFAQFDIIGGKLLPDGKYQRPTVSLVCNFPPPGADGKPSLLSHSEVETLFHEFGHALHAQITRAKFARFAGTGVPRDFVEAPSQMLENWTWDKAVLDTFAADYRDPAKKFPADTLEKMKAARLATTGVYWRRQFALAALDLALHAPHSKDQPYDSRAVANAALERVLLPIDPSTAYVASFGHLAGGYDAGYYGYSWARAIAADLATVFQKSPGGFMDKGVGMRLRNEIYATGGSREAGVSIEKFLGRKQSNQPFLEDVLGLGKPDAPAAARTDSSTVK